MVLVSSLEEMEQLTREFREGIVQPDGGRILKQEHLKYQSEIHFDIPNLSYDILCEVPRLLVRTTIFPNGARYGNSDQYPFWLWMAEVCNYRKWDFEYRDKRFSDLFGLLISSHLAVGIPFPSYPNYYLSRFLGSFHIFATCYAFPFLERCIRYKCHEYVNDDGYIIQDFSIPRFGRSDREYSRGQFISNISHELKLLDKVATTNFREILRRFMDELNEDSWLRLDDPYEIIGNWRNMLLHGEHIWSSGWDATTCLICLVLLSEINAEEYNSKLADLKEDITWRQKQSTTFLWYPYKIE